MLKTLLIFIVFSFFMGSLQGQLIADFVVNEKMGCAPHIVNLTDNSTGGNISFRKWDFGNGNFSLGNNPNPSSIYSSSGLYSITLTISDGVDTAVITKSNYINVTNPPNAGILMPINKGCVPFNLVLTDNSTSTSTPLVSWEWSFDDGAPVDTNQNVSHLFTFKGSYHISLKITDSLGCSDFTTFPSPFIGFKPKAKFPKTQTLYGCHAPFNVNVQNLSTGTAPLNYIWKVDNNISNALNLSTNINQSGNYDIFLQVEDSLGCIDSLRVPNIITVDNIFTSINISDTLCKGIVNQFRTNSTSSASYFWDFGNGVTKRGKKVSHSYINSGVYDIIVIPQYSVGCTDTIRKNIYVDSVTASFTSSPHFSCQLPAYISFQGQSSSNVVNWLWSFGSGAGSHNSSLKNPIDTITRPGIYNDTLTVSSSSGCTSSFVLLANDSIIVTQANFTPDVIEGCAPLTVNFQNTTSPISDIKQVIWDFGSGTQNTHNNSAKYSSSFTFQKPGIYNVKLTIISFTGCQTSLVQKISVGTPQNASFHLDTNLSCGSHLVSCFNNSSNQSLINSTYWDFGDGNFSRILQPQHIFQDTGYLNISLTVGYNGCFTTNTIDSALYINGPILKYDYQVDCLTPNKFSFTPSSLGGTDFTWDFGDGTPLDSLNWDVDHYFTVNTGDFIVSFSGLDSNTGCKYTNAQTIHVRDLQAHLTSSDSIVCKGAPVSFSISSSKDAFGFVEWTKNNWSNPITLGPSKSYSFNNHGINTVFAIVYDVNKCTDTVQLDIEVFEPSPMLYASAIIGCSPLTVQFLDSSISDTNIVSWDWNFGNGASANFQNGTHTFVNSRNKSYDIELTVVDTFGCENSIKFKNHISVNNPKAFFTTNKNTICAMDSIKFSPISPRNNLYWDFGDNSTSLITKPSHTYKNGGTYSVSLQVTDNLGCTNTFQQISNIQVNDLPTVNFAADTITKNCYPSSVTFTNTNINGTDWEWNFGDTSRNIPTNTGIAQHLFSKPGKYDISLRITNVFGCSDSLTKSQYITIGGPEARLKAATHSECTGSEFEFNIDQINNATTNFTLDFGDGMVSNLMNPRGSISHIYPYPGDYHVTLLISDSYGKCVKTKYDSISVIEVAALFDIAQAIGCVPLETLITNQSTGSSTQVWMLDSIIKSYDTTLNLHINQPGIHQLQLMVWNDSLSCGDTLTKKIEVYDLPQISASNDTSICLGTSIPLFATGAEYYSWQPTTGLDDSFHSNPNSNVTANITYTITGVDSNGCENSDNIQISVIQKPIIYSFSNDTIIYDGNDYMLHVNTSPGLNIMWSSNSFLSCYGCLSPYIEPLVKDTYHLSYGDTLGCFTSDTSVTIDVTSFRVFVPNSFTPNGDGLNDIFIPLTEGVDRLMYLYIFDQWGSLVFETTDLTYGWDGFQNGQLCQNSTYAYQFRVIGYDGKTAEYTGYVNLLQ